MTVSPFVPIQDTFCDMCPAAEGDDGRVVPGARFVEHACMRRGVPPEVIEKLKGSFRYLLQSKLNTTKAMQQIRRDRSLACPEVDYLLQFIQTSQRGVILRRATRRAEVLAEE